MSVAQTVRSTPEAASMTPPDAWACNHDGKIPVLADKFAVGWPSTDSAKNATPVKRVSIGAALSAKYKTDAHIACYSSPTAHRLNSDAVGKTRIVMTAVLFDIDGPDHKCEPAWWDDTRGKLFDLRHVDAEAGPTDALAYQTRGGCRVAYRLRRPIRIEDASDERAWHALTAAWRKYLDRNFGLRADDGCGEWNRLFRLPFATRSAGKSEDLEIIGELNAIGYWDNVQLTADDMQTEPERVHGNAGQRFTGYGVTYNLFSDRGWIGKELSPGMWSARCPWSASHTSGKDYDSSTVVFAPGPGQTLGSLHCKHEHCVDRSHEELLHQFTESQLTEAGYIVRREKQSRQSSASGANRDDEAPDGSGSSDSDGWHDTLPLPGDVWPVPTFEPELLPEALRGWVGDVAERAQCPIEYVAIGAMVSLSAVTGRRHFIQPKRHDDWTVIPNLWGAAVGPPGVMKSPALKETLRPLERLAIRSREQHERNLDQFAFDEAVVKAKRDAVVVDIKAAVKRGDDPSDLRSALEACCVVPPTEKRYIINDSTVEKLGELLNQNPNGLLLFRDELMGWLAQLDRDGHESDRAFYLEAWSGDSSFTYDRIGRGTVHIKAACVAMLGGIQPGPLGDHLAAAVKGGSGADGLMQRFQLLVYPDIAKEWKNVDRWPDTDAKNRAFEVFDRIESSEPSGWRFDAAGQAIFDDWREDLEKRLRSEDEAPVMASHLSKFRKLMPALSLLFQLVDGGDIVTATSASRAVRWCALLESHARRVYQAVTERRFLAARAIAKRLQGGKLTGSFTARDIYRAQWAGLTDREDVEGGLEVLDDLHWVRGELVSGSGRPKLVYTVNPKVCAL